MVTPMRPSDPSGKPLLVCGDSRLQLLPPSLVTKRPEPDGLSTFSPPDRKVQPLRRKSHRAAKILSGDLGSMEMEAQPVDRFSPFRIRRQVLPPSSVR